MNRLRKTFRIDSDMPRPPWGIRFPTFFNGILYFLTTLTGLATLPRALPSAIALLNTAPELWTVVVVVLCFVLAVTMSGFLAIAFAYEIFKGSQLAWCGTAVMLLSPSIAFTLSSSYSEGMHKLTWMMAAAAIPLFMPSARKHCAISNPAVLRLTFVVLVAAFSLGFAEERICAYALNLRAEFAVFGY